MCSIYQSTTNLPHVCLPILRRRTPEGIDTPLTRRVARSCYLCAGAIYVVLLGSPTGSITLVSNLREITTADVLHHPFTTREKPSSSAGFRPISSAGRCATDKALQLTYSSSMPPTTLLLNRLSSSDFPKERYW